MPAEPTEGRSPPLGRLKFSAAWELSLDQILGEINVRLALSRSVPKDTAGHHRASTSGRRGGGRVDAATGTFPVADMRELRAEGKARPAPAAMARVKSCSRSRR